MFSLMEELPAEMAQNVALKDGVLYFSDALKNDPVFISYTSRFRRRGVVSLHAVPAEEFHTRYAVYRRRADDDDNDNVIISYGKALLQAAFEKRATDIHLAYYGAYGLIQFRCMGLLQDYTKETGDFIKKVIAVIYGSFSQAGNTTQFIPDSRQDARIAARQFLPPEVHSVRVHTEPLESAHAKGGLGTLMTLRLLYDRTEAKGGLEERLGILGYGHKDNEKFRLLTERTGLTIISGPTGHGKSTLLKHVMEAQSEEHPEKAFMSIEDPPEYPLSNVKQVKVTVNDKDADLDKRGREYTNAIAGALRSDPDVIMIGEIRYPEAAVAAVNAALTGHGVFATLHANNALGIIMRMVSLMNAASYADPLEYLCDHNVLAGLVYQRLVPVLCPNCKMPLSHFLQQTPSPEDLRHKQEVLPPHTAERLLRVVDDPSGIYIKGRGCESCDHLGIVSQTVAAEVIVTDEVLLRYVRRGAYDQAYSYWLKEMGGRSYIQHAIEGISEGRLDPYMTELRLGVPLNFVRSLGERGGETK